MTMDQITQELGVFAPLAISIVQALAVLVVGWIIARWVSAVIRARVFASEQIDNTIGSFVASVARWLILLVVVIAVLNIFGVATTSLVAVLGAATLAIGMALQGTMSDLAAGFMLIIFRPYKLEQYVDIGGTAGTVKDINLFVTELVTPDNVQIIMPNGKAWGSVITNYSHHQTRRVDLTFGIDYGDDADRAMKIITEIASADTRVHSDPEPWVRVTNLGDSSVDLTTRLWCDAADYWNLKFELTKQIKEGFDKGGISIPYPHQVEIHKTG